MAQALFEDHPLKEYLREIGEEVPTMPGGGPEFGGALDEDADEDSENEQEWMPPVILKTFTLIQALLSSLHSPPQSRFEEQFKYDVISSNLLSSSLPAPSNRLHTYTSQNSIHIPGHLRSSRDTSIDEAPFGAIDLTEPPATSPPAPTSESPVIPVVAVLGYAYLPHLLALLAAVLAVSGCYSCAALLFSGALYLTFASRQTTSKSHQEPSSTAFEVLHELIQAGNAWDFMVNDAFSIVELDEKRYEKSAYCSPASPSSPASPLRISLQTTLHTTTTQCDNIRQLLSALTCPTSLSQLSEMYAPPSPSASPLRQTFTGSSSSSRPSSFPERSGRYGKGLDTDEEREQKRATWNGSYTSLAYSGKERRKDKRRSDLSAVLQAPQIASAPTSPSLPEVKEEDAAENMQAESTRVEGEDKLADEHFGKDALGLRRKRRVRGLNSVLGMSTPPPSAPPSPLSPRHHTLAEGRPRTQSLTKRRSMASLSSPFSTGSRYTLLPASRHPLSLSSIHTSLQSALAAKRYACSHLLALRFNDEDEAYWEDVKSVVGLLKSTFEDASERLSEALQETCDRRDRDGSMSPLPLGGHSRVASLEKTSAHAEKERTAKVMADLLMVPSYAPMPSQLSRFATHVDTISTALNDARVHLEECIVALRHAEPEDEEVRAESEQHPALQAYERLRRELGLALRECERGRERLLDILTPSDAAHTESEDDEMPTLGPDVGSDESDKHDSLTPVVYSGSTELVTVMDPEGDGEHDDVTSHLLLGTSSQHLPPPGIEQVFESEVVEGKPFGREKSKLSREERIRLMKERREKAGSLYLAPASAEDAEVVPVAERWGPGGDVVQELKDVIWQVGEKRRKIGEGHRRSLSAGNPEMTPALPTPEHEVEEDMRTLS